MKRSTILGILGMEIIGGLFLFSAIVKLIPNINYFVQTIESQLGLSSFLSLYLARMVIGVEFGLGLLMIAQQRGKKQWVLKSSLIMLIAFTIHLFLLYFREGNDVNCGCMGDFIEMSPLTSIGKNIILIIINVVLLKYGKDNSHIWNKNMPSFLLKSEDGISGKKTIKPSVVWGLFLASVLVIFFVSNKGTAEEVIWGDLLIPGTSWEQNEHLTEGKSFVAFLSLTCGHCMDAAKELNELKKEDDDLPIYVVFQFMASSELTQESYERFEMEVGDLEMPTYFADTRSFVEFLVNLGHDGVPVMMWIQDGKVQRHTPGRNFNKKEVKKWLK